MSSTGVTTPNIPPTTVPVLGGDGQFSLPWRRWLQTFSNSANLTPAQIAALEAAIAAAAGNAEHALQIAQEALAASGGSSVSALDLLAVATAGEPQATLPSLMALLALSQLDFVAIVATFGTGAPVAAGKTEGDLYYDTTVATYVGYVWHAVAWHQIA